MEAGERVDPFFIFVITASIIIVLAIKLHNT